jgi:HlyD family secretion protein
MFIMPMTSNKSEAEPAPAKPAPTGPPDIESASVPDTLATPQVKPDRPSSHRVGQGYRNKIIFALSIVGILAGMVGAYIFGMERKAQPPVFQPVSSPYESAIYANGIIESDQTSGANINIYPEVSGPITQVLVREGQRVSAGTPLLTIDDSVQRANTEQLRLQSEASLALLNELNAQPRAEALAIATAQVALAESNLKAAHNQYDKRRASYDLDSKSISKDVLDTAEDAVKQAAVAREQYDLTKAGAWSYDIVNQEKQHAALEQAYKAANAMLQKYAVNAPVGGVVLAVNATAGSYVSSQGAYDPYTQGLDPLVVMGAPHGHLAVRCYVDEILVSRLPSPRQMRRANVDPRHRHQGAARVRPGAAVCFAQDRAIESAPGESRPAGAAGDFPVREKGRPGLSGPAGGCIHRGASAPPDQSQVRTNAVNNFRSSVQRDACFTVIIAMPVVM